jgi:hypothetical protein
LAITSPLFVEPALQLVEPSWGTPDEVLLPTAAVLGFVIIVNVFVSLSSLASSPDLTPPNQALQATAAVLCGSESVERHNAVVAGASMDLRSPIVRSSSHTMIVAGVLLFISLWPLLVAFEEWSFSYVLPFTVSLPLAVGFLIGCLVELLRRGWSFQVFVMMLLSGLAVAAWLYSCVLRFRYMAYGVA